MSKDLVSYRKLIKLFVLNLYSQVWIDVFVCRVDTFLCRKIQKSAQTDLFDINFLGAQKGWILCRRFFHVVRSGHPDFIWLTGPAQDLTRREKASDTKIKKFCSSCREVVSKRAPVYCSTFFSMLVWSKTTHAHAHSSLFHVVMRWDEEMEMRC